MVYIEIELHQCSHQDDRCNVTSPRVLKTSEAYYGATLWYFIESRAHWNQRSVSIWCTA